MFKDSGCTLVPHIQLGKADNKKYDIWEGQMLEARFPLYVLHLVCEWL